MVNFQRLRPTRTTLAALVGLVWALSFGAARDFVWADLRTGMVELRGLSRTTRALVWIGFALLFAMVGALLFNDLWREWFPLRPLGNGVVGRGTLLPVVLPPVTIFLITVAWSFVLAGALHSHPALRGAALLVYSLTAAAWLQPILQSTFVTPRELVQGWGALLGTPLLFGLRWRAPARPVPEFLALLALVGGVFLYGFWQNVQSSRAFGISLELSYLDYHVVLLAALVEPLLLLIGLDIATFTRRASGWLSAALAERLPGWLLGLVLGGWLLRRLGDVLAEASERVAATSLPVEALAYLGALGELALVALVWWGVARLARGAPRPDEEAVAEAAERHAFPLILVWNAVGLATFFVLTLGVLFPTSWLAQQASAVGDALVAAIPGWNVLVAGAALVAGVALARRGQRALALYLALFGALNLWWMGTGVGRPLGALAYHGAQTPDFWWVLLLAGVALLWLLRGQLTAARAGRLLFLLLVTALIRQSDFIENPFSPFFAFAGIGFIAFGLVWDSLTIGAWANEGTPALPRTSRLLLYVGYVLLTVTVLNWALTTHNLNMVGEFTGDAALRGFTRFGLPLLYALFPLLLTQPPDA